MRGWVGLPSSSRRGSLGGGAPHRAPSPSALENSALGSMQAHWLPRVCTGPGTGGIYLGRGAVHRGPLPLLFLHPGPENKLLWTTAWQRRARSCSEQHLLTSASHCHPGTPLSAASLAPSRGGGPRGATEVPVSQDSRGRRSPGPPSSTPEDLWAGGTGSSSQSDKEEGATCFRRPWSAAEWNLGAGGGVAAN